MNLEGTISNGIEEEEDEAPPTLFASPRRVDPPPTEAQIERQIHWEHDAIDAGIRRYRAGVNAPGRELADTSPGQKLIRKILDDFVLILDCYKDAVETRCLERAQLSVWLVGRCVKREATQGKREWT